MNIQKGQKKVLVSGVQPSGKPHIGNYFGAIKQNIELGNSGTYDAFVFLADYHSMTTLKDPVARAENTLDAAATYLACGLDPKKVTFFKQSDVPEHAELAWIFNTITTMPFLMRAHAFKDQEAKNKEVNVGLFDYPVLMAADILIYHADVVPVGADQKQHIEITRDIAEKFNLAWGKTFALPADYIVKDVATIPGIDGEKMSKSKNNHIPLFASDAELGKRVMGIVSDSKGPSEPKDPDTNNIYRIHRLFLSESDDTALRAKYTSGGLGYKEAKEMLLTSIHEWRKDKLPIYEHYMNNPEEVKMILAEGGKRARRRAQETMANVRKIVGLDF